MAIQLYSEEEINEVLQWFEDHKDKLPKTLKLNHALTIDDLNFTINRLKFIALNYGDKPSFKGEIMLLFNIREHLCSETDYSTR